LSRPISSTVSTCGQHGVCPGCQALAARLQVQDSPFAQLDAAQLLKHALGLANAGSGRYSLWYIFLDITSAESRRHRQDLTAFADAVDEVLGFRWITYQDLMAALRQQSGPGDLAYVEYLMARYGAISAQ
jgi:hypothetical protein